MCVHKDWTSLLRNILSTKYACVNNVSITSTFKEYWGQAWADYIVTIATYAAVPVVSQHVSLYSSTSTITRRHCSKFSITPMSTWISQHSSTVSSSAVLDSHKRVGKFSCLCRQLQLHCLNRLNPFIPCVCTFTYLSSSVIFTADTSSSSRPCCSIKCMHAVVNGTCEHVNIPEYTEQFRAYTDLRNQGATNAG